MGDFHLARGGGFCLANGDINENFQKLVAYLKQEGTEIGRNPENDPEYQRFISQFPAERLTALTLDEYCVGKGLESFCWWIERGLINSLGRYSPGSSKGHILYFQKDGTVYKNRFLAHLTDEEALRYTLKIQSVIANANVDENLQWIDDDVEIYRRAEVDPLVTIGVGRKLRLLSCYLFITQAKLMAQLHAARAIDAYDRKLQQLARIDLLAIDDFGLRPMRSAQDEDFHDLIAERYEKRATILTSNLDFDEWGAAFPNKLMGAATLDRLRDGAYRIVLDGESRRKFRTLPDAFKPAGAVLKKGSPPVPVRQR